MKIKKILSICSLTLVHLIFSATAQATIYKCINAKAEVYYNDKPCPLNDKESEIKAVKDPEGGYIPPEYVADPVDQSIESVFVGKEDTKKINDRNLEERNSVKKSNGKIASDTANNNSSENNSYPSQSGSSSGQNSNMSENKVDSGSAKKMEKVSATLIEPFS